LLYFQQQHKPLKGESEMTVVTIQVPDHQMLSVQSIAKVIHHVGYSLDAIDFKLPHDAVLYQAEENHIFLSSIGDCVYSVKRGVE
jgi:hypothetical protein